MPRLSAHDRISVLADQRADSTPAEAADWILYIAGRATVELSGGINLETVKAYAEAGPDFISCGAITHSAVAVDISFRIELNRF